MGVDARRVVGGGRTGTGDVAGVCRAVARGQRDSTEDAGSGEDGNTAAKGTHDGTPIVMNEWVPRGTAPRRGRSAVPAPFSTYDMP
jgi:hypothetical protein